MTLTDTDTVAAASTGTWDVVLGPTARGEEELQRHLFPLSPAQRDLLAALDGRRSLRQLVVKHPALHTPRLARDAARLLAFGLVRQLRGELPRDLVVSAMNLTMRVPAAAFRHLAARAEETAPARASVEQHDEPAVQSWPWYTIALASVVVLLIVVWPLL